MKKRGYNAINAYFSIALYFTSTLNYHRFLLHNLNEKGKPFS